LETPQTEVCVDNFKGEPMSAAPRHLLSSGEEACCDSLLQRERQSIMAVKPEDRGGGFLGVNPPA
jgi:hypothetical protein